METAPSEPRIRVGPQHQVIQQADVCARIDVLREREREREKKSIEGMSIN